MKALVTGGCGFIGSNLVSRLVALGWDVVVVDNVAGRDYFSPAVHAQVKFINSTVSQYLSKDAFDEVFDVVFHQAAITDTGASALPLLIHQNVLEFSSALSFAMSCKAKFIYASSASVYGNGSGPMSLYAISKSCCDSLAKFYIDRDYPVIGLRYFNVYGPNEAHKGTMSSVVRRFYYAMSAGQRPLVFSYGQHQRDFVYVDDVVEANILASALNHGVILDVGTGAPVSYNTVVSELNKLLKTSLDPEYIPNPFASQYQSFTRASVDRMHGLLSFSPKYSFDAGVRKYVSLLKEENGKDKIRK